MRRASILISYLLLLSALLLASPITFSGGRTTVISEKGAELITLTEGASIHVDDLLLRADEIVLSGEEYRRVESQGSVSVVDEAADLSLFTSTLIYDRFTRLMDVIGYVEIDDRANEVQLSAFRLYYDLENEVLEAEASVLLLRHTDRGVMVCQSEQLVFDRKQQHLILRGKPTIEWDGNRYAAELITVNLESEEIMMRGAISGVIGD